MCSLVSEFRLWYSSSLYITILFLLFREIIGTYSENHSKLINTLWQNTKEDGGEKEVLFKDIGICKDHAYLVCNSWMKYIMENWRGKIKKLWGKSFPVPLFLLQIPRGLVWDRRSVSALKWWCLTAWSRHSFGKIMKILHYSRRYMESPQDFERELNVQKETHSTFQALILCRVYNGVTN